MQNKEEKKLKKATMSRREMLKLLGGAATGAAILSACQVVVPTPPPAAPAEGEAEAPAAEAPAMEPVAMTVLHRREYFKEMEDLFREAVLDWAGENNVEMEVSTVGAEAFEDFVAKLVASVEAGNPADLVYHIRLVQQLLFLDALEPVSDAAEKAESLYGAVPVLNRDLNFVDGTWWGIPFSVHGSGQFARRDVFEAAGIDPDSMETYDQRREGALAASNPDEEMLRLGPHGQPQRRWARFHFPRHPQLGWQHHRRRYDRADLRLAGDGGGGRVVDRDLHRRRVGRDAAAWHQ